MEVETKFLRLFKSVAIGDRIDEWRVCWVGGWDKCRVLFVVMCDRGNRAHEVGEYHLRRHRCQDLEITISSVETKVSIVMPTA